MAEGPGSESAIARLPTAVTAFVGRALRGPVNLVCPRPITNAEFTKTLGRALKRPTIFPMPAFAVRLAATPPDADDWKDVRDKLKLLER